MKAIHLIAILLVLVAGTLLGAGEAAGDPVPVPEAGTGAPPPEVAAAFAVDLDALYDALAPDLRTYRALPYLRCAAGLRAVGRERALAFLKGRAAQEGTSERTEVLCRLLFRAAEGGSFRRMMSGAPSFVGELPKEHIPLDPIVLFEGVPILVRSGLACAGCPEPPAAYLAYCEEELIFVEDAAEEVEPGDLPAIHERFIAFLKTKASPRDSEVDWLRAQAGG